MTQYFFVGIATALALFVLRNSPDKTWREFMCSFPVICFRGIRNIFTNTKEVSQPVRISYTLLVAGSVAFVTYTHTYTQPYVWTAFLFVLLPLFLSIAQERIRAGFVASSRMEVQYCGMIAGVGLGSIVGTYTTLGTLIDPSASGRLSEDILVAVILTAFIIGGYLLAYTIAVYERMSDGDAPGVDSLEYLTILSILILNIAMITFSQPHNLLSYAISGYTIGLTYISVFVYFPFFDVNNERGEKISLAPHTNLRWFLYGLIAYITISFALTWYQAVGVTIALISTYFTTVRGNTVTLIKKEQV